MHPTLRRYVVLVAVCLVGCASTRSVTPQAAPAAIDPTGQAFEGWVLERLEDEVVQGRDDLDGDGTDDCWRAMPSRGGGFRSVTLTVRPSCTGAVMTLASLGHALDLVTPIPVPLAWRRNPALLQGALSMLYGAGVVRVSAHVEGSGVPVADGLAPLLIASVRHEALPPRRESSSPFARVDALPVTWQPGPPTLPGPQAVAMVAAEPALRRALFGDRTGKQTPEMEAAGSPWALVLVHSRPHAAPVEVATCGRWTLYSTGHALAAHERESDHHAWLFGSARGTHPLEASLLQVACQQGLVFLEPRLTSDERRMLVIHPDAGRVGQVPLRKSDRWWLHRPSRELQKTGGTYSTEAMMRGLAPTP